MVLELLSILAPVFVCAALGFGWARSGRPYDQEFVTTLIMNFGAPCLIFSQLVSLRVERDVIAQMALGAVLAIVGFTLIGTLVLRVMRLPRHTYLGPLVFCNAGNMGLALCLFTFGPEGLSLASVFFAVMSITHYTAGVWIWSGRASLRELLQTPMSYAAVLAVLVLLTDFPVPQWIQNTTELLGALTIPLMLLTLGVSLSRMHVSRLPRAVGLSVLRLSMGFAIGVALSELLGFEGVARGVLILECSMPSAVFNYIFAQRYQRSPDEVASLVLVSTLIALVVLPFLLAWLL